MDIYNTMYIYNAHICILYIFLNFPMSLVMTCFLIKQFRKVSCVLFNLSKAV